MASRSAVIKWLLDSDPSIRWQVMRDLTDEPGEAVAAERSRVASEGWGAQLLGLQTPDGHWGDDQKHGWMTTNDALAILKDLGVDPASEQVRKAIGLVRDRITWWQLDGRPFFDGETEACINGRILAAGAYFGEDSERLLERLLGEQLEDGGWNCEAPPSKRSSFHSTICVLEGLLEYEKARGAKGSGDRRSDSGTGLSPGAPYAQVAVIGRGDRSPLDALLLSDHLALRRAAGAGLLAQRRHPSR